MILLDEEMMIGGTDINPAGLKFRPIAREGALESFVLSETVQQGFAGVFGIHVLNNENCRREVGRQLTDESIQDFEPSRRGSDHNHVMPASRHTVILLPVAPIVAHGPLSAPSTPRRCTP